MILWYFYHTSDHILKQWRADSGGESILPASLSQLVIMGQLLPLVSHHVHNVLLPQNKQGKKEYMYIYNTFGLFDVWMFLEMNALSLKDQR